MMPETESHSPQLENGYTRIANEWLEAFIVASYPASVKDFVLVIVRATWGFNRKDATIPISRFQEYFGVTRARIYQIRDDCLRHNLIEVDEGEQFEASTYRVQKRYLDWIEWSPKKANRLHTIKDAVDSKGRSRQSSTQSAETVKGVVDNDCQGRSIPNGKDTLKTGEDRAELPSTAPPQSSVSTVNEGIALQTANDTGLMMVLRETQPAIGNDTYRAKLFCCDLVTQGLNDNTRPAITIGWLKQQMQDNPPHGSQRGQSWLNQRWFEWQRKQERANGHEPLLDEFEAVYGPNPRKVPGHQEQMQWERHFRSYKEDPLIYIYSYHECREKAAELGLWDGELDEQRARERIEERNAALANR